MKNTGVTRGQSRRDVLRLGAASVPVAAAAVVGTSDEAQAVETVTPSGEPRMQRTAHVAKYFETARF